MPIYEYQCRQCEKEFELLIRGQEQPACPECGSDQLQRLMSAPAAHTASGDSLPTCNDSWPVPTCGRPECQQGGCQGVG